MLYSETPAIIVNTNSVKNRDFDKIKKFANRTDSQGREIIINEVSKFLTMHKMKE